MTANREPASGSQRLSVEQLENWRRLEFGMFIHYGMSTFSTEKAPGHCKRLPIDRYAPTKLEVDQWVAVARDAGMKYIILTTKHGTGFCIWPTKYSDYNVANSPCPVDVFEAFAAACDKYGVMPALYFAGETVKGFGSPACTLEDPADREKAFYEYITGQLTELLTQYGPIGEVWFDGPGQYGLAGRRRLYDFVAGLQPQAVVAMNGAFDTNGLKSVVKPHTWPTDVIVIEAGLVPYVWRDRLELGEDVTGEAGEPKEYFLPTECVTCIDNDGERWWFGGPSARVRSDLELLAMRIICRERKANIVFNIPPTPEGRLRQDYVDCLTRLRKRLEQVYGD